MGMKDFNRAGIGIPEERQFTNPHIRFIRKNGRVIPIMNKKRIGQDKTAMGEKAMRAGITITAAGIIKHRASKTKLGRKLRKASIPFHRDARSLKQAILKTKFGKRATFAGKHRAVKFASRVTGKAIKKSFKNMTKFGLATTAIGTGLAILGSQTQMRSPFGKDFFFVRDQHGKGS